MKWYLLGRSLTHDESELQRQAFLAERLINELIGKNLTPSYPIYILFMLQQIEAQTPLETTSATGSYGFLYKSLLTTALSASSQLAIDLDTQYSYLAELAYHVFRNHALYINKDDFYDWHQEFCERYGLRLNLINMQSSFSSAGILETHDHKISFKYPYVYYYFIGRYFRDNLDDKEVKLYIDAMSKRLHHTEKISKYINVFDVSYKRPIYPVFHHKCVYWIVPQFEECNVVDNSTFLNDLASEIPRLVLDGSDAEQRRRKVLEKKDEFNLLTNPMSKFLKIYMM